MKLMSLYTDYFCRVIFELQPIGNILLIAYLQGMNEDGTTNLEQGFRKLINSLY